MFHEKYNQHSSIFAVRYGSAAETITHMNEVESVVANHIEAFPNGSRVFAFSGSYSNYKTMEV